MTDTFLKRFKRTIDEKGITQSELSKKTGIRASSISDYYNGKYVPKQDKITLLANALNVSPSWLACTVNDENHKNTDKTNKVFPSTSAPVLPITAAAGSPWDYESGTEFDEIEIPDVLLGKYAGKKTIGVAKVNGESMNRDIPNGSWIIVDRAKNELNMLKNRDIVLVRDSAGYTVKRIIISHNEVILKPNSTFDEFRDIVINEVNKHDYRLVGKVVKALIDFDEQ
ncbi:LexA family protein [Peptostreptococcus faecalis]|uniref:LexA family protein n=1 Tax=Peptostreptococcus faecalis TaxID=2045015 RepID=UPI000C79D949|nr:XRE family transcriptional regulator [Peptostreptococcus faecalis]